MIEQNIRESKRKMNFKQFEYVNHLTDFFNSNPQYELITFTMGRHDTFIALYYSYEEEKDTNIKANS